MEVYNYFNSNTAKKENDKSILNDLAGSSYQPEKITFKLQYRTATVEHLQQHTGHGLMLIKQIIKMY